MLLTEREVYEVGYKQGDNESWQTSGKLYSTIYDAQWNAKQLAKHAKCETKVFKFGRALPMEDKEND